MRYKRFFTAIDGVVLSYADIRPELNRVMCFIHGNGNSADLWHYQLASPLFEEYRLIAIDLPSHGQSADAQGNSIAFFGDLVAEFVRSVAPSSHLVLVGLSLGGNIVAEMLRSIASPAGIVIISSALVGNEISVSDIPTNALVAKVLFSTHATDKEIQRYFDAVLWRNDAPDKAILLEDYQRVSPVFRQEYPLSIQRGEYSDEISLIRNAGMPILLVTGSHDDIIPPSLLANVPLQRWNEIRCTFPHSGHFPNLDEPDGFNALLHDYLVAIHNRS